MKPTSEPNTVKRAKAYVYSGPHYGRLHTVIGRNQFSNLIEVEYRGDRFSVPACDVEMAKEDR